MVEWLNQNNGAVQAVGTAALVMVTAAYVLLTFSLSRSTKQQADILAEQARRDRSAADREIVRVASEVSPILRHLVRARVGGEADGAFGLLRQDGDWERLDRAASRASPIFAVPAEIAVDAARGWRSSTALHEGKLRDPEAGREALIRALDALEEIQKINQEGQLMHFPD
jgi:hypothetical protein